MDGRYRYSDRDDLIGQIGDLEARLRAVGEELLWARFRNVALRADYEGEQTHTAYLRERLRDVSRALGNTSCNADYSDLAPAVAAMREQRELLRVALAMTMIRIGNGYDWNADPDGMTLVQGKALEVRQ